MSHPQRGAVGSDGPRWVGVFPSLPFPTLGDNHAEAKDQANRINLEEAHHHHQITPPEKGTEAEAGYLAAQRVMRTSSDSGQVLERLPWMILRFQRIEALFPIGIDHIPGLCTMDCIAAFDGVDGIDDIAVVQHISDLVSFDDFKLTHPVVGSTINLPPTCMSDPVVIRINAYVRDSEQSHDCPLGLNLISPRTSRPNQKFLSPTPLGRSWVPLRDYMMTRPA
jgi:hypothetical protein